MSKMLEKYKEMKKSNPQKIYLFECGIFYISFNEDAKILEKELNLKLISINKEDKKCGFPINSKNKYANHLNEKNIDYEIISNDNIIKKQKNVKIKPNKEEINSIEKEIIRKLNLINVEYCTPL